MKTLVILPVLSLLCVANAQEPQHADPVGAVAVQVPPRAPQGPGSPVNKPQQGPELSGVDESTASVRASGRVPPANPKFGRVQIHTGEDDLGQTYGTWAVGETYKVSFHGAPTFVPYLGSAAPRNLPLTWHTQSVTAGGQPLVNAAKTPVRHNTDFRYEYRYGAFTEAYDVLEEGLEQTFVIHQRPAAGDIVVTGRFETPMTADSFGSAHRAIEFRGDDGHVYVKYSEAFAFDAKGRRTDINTSYENGIATLTVDAAWLEDATFPVTIDPLATRERVSGGSLRETCDIARDDAANRVMVVFVRIASAPDRDAYAQVIDDCFTQGPAGGNIVWNDVTSTWDTPHIRCCAMDSPRTYLIGLDRIFPNLSQNQHRCRVHTRLGSDTTLSTQYLGWEPGGSVSSGEHDWRCDVGGTNWTSTGDTGIIVFQREDTGGLFANDPNSRVFARTIDTSGGVGAASSVSGDIALTPDNPLSNVDLEYPDVNQEAHTNDYVWFCVWQEYNNSGTNDDWDSIGRLITDNGVESSAHWFNQSSNNGQHKMGNSVDGQLGRYLVAYSNADVSFGKIQTRLGNGCQAERVDWSSGGTIQKFDEEILWSGNTDLRFRVGDVGYDWETDSHWVVPSISDRVIGPGSGNIYLHRCGYGGAELEQVTLHSFAGTSSQVGYDASVYYDDDSNLFQVAYAANADPSMVNVSLNAVYGNCYSYDAYTTATPSGASCSTANISWYGSQQIGSEFCGMRLSGLPTTAVSVMAVSLGSANQPAIGAGIGAGCRLLVDNGAPFLGFTNIGLGSSVSWQLSLPEWLASSNDLYLQGWHTNASGSLFLSTRRLVVDIVK